MILNMILNPSSWLSIRIGLIGLSCKLSTFKTLSGLKILVTKIGYEKLVRKFGTKIGDKLRFLEILV